MEGNPLEVQWLGLCTSTAGGPSSIPRQGTKIPASCKLHSVAKNKNKKRKAMERTLKHFKQGSTRFRFDLHYNKGINIERENVMEGKIKSILERLRIVSQKR